MSAGHVVNGTRLQQTEVSSRAYVRQHPEDMKARLELAWCLLVEALYLAGRETSLSTGWPSHLAADQPQSTEAAGEYDALHVDDGTCRSNELFRECLHHAATVQQLSVQPEDRLSAAHLQSLVQLSGGESALAASQTHLLSRALAIFVALNRPAEDTL